MLLGLAHSKFHFIRKGSVVERSTIRAFFCGMLLTASSALLNTQELPFKPIWQSFRTKPASLDQFENLKMQTSTFVKSVCAVYLVLTAGLTLGAGLLV